MPCLVCSAGCWGGSFRVALHVIVMVGLSVVWFNAPAEPIHEPEQGLPARTSPGPSPWSATQRFARAAGATGFATLARIIREAA